MQGFPLFAARKRSMLLRMVVLVLPVVFMVTLLSQTVLAQNTFVITDGDDVIVHTSYATDPAEALTEAGIDVDQDEYSATQNEEGGYDITVQRNDAGAGSMSDVCSKADIVDFKWNGSAGGN